MKTSQLFKKLIWVIPITFLCLLSFTLVQANAASHESPWVLDNAKVLNQRTIKRIDDLNKNQLSKIKGHPQYAVITVDGIPDDKDDIEDYTHDKFNDMGLGRKGWHNGVLFVLDPKDHKYRVEVGTGLQGALPDGDEEHVITEAFIHSLKVSNYNKAVSLVSENIFNQIDKNQKKILNVSQVRTKESSWGYKHSNLYGMYEGSFAHGFWYGMLVLLFWFLLFVCPVLVLISLIHRCIVNLKFRIELHAMKKMDSDYEKKLREAGVDKPSKYLNYIPDSDRKKLFLGEKSGDLAFFTTALIKAHEEYLKHPNGNDGTGNYYGGSGGDDSFGSGFGGDSGGSSGGGFSGDW